MQEIASFFVLWRVSDTYISFSRDGNVLSAEYQLNGYSFYMEYLNGNGTMSTHFFYWGAIGLNLAYKVPRVLDFLRFITYNTKEQF